MNFLILSAGTRNKVVQYFRKAFKDGKIIAADMSELAPAIYEADKYYIVPAITDNKYIDVIIDICKKENINGITSLIDPELSLLAKNKNRFDDIGVMLIGSSYELCERSLDKFQMYQWLVRHGYHCARSYIDKELFYSDADSGLISYPVFVKPAKGSASIAISKAYDKETVEILFKHSDGLMIQEYLKGQEIGADVYIDMISHKVVSIFAKKKLAMRAGETDKSVSFKDNKLFELITQFSEESGFTGQIDIDIFEINGQYYISEVNPRFGGGYPHAYECGCDHTKLILNNINGIINEKCIGEYPVDVYMMKFNEVLVRGTDNAK